MSSAEASRPLTSRTVRRPVVSWLISRMARIGFSRDRSRITTPDSSIRSTRSVDADLEQRRRLGHVGVADDDVQAAVALGVGVRLVASVDDRAGPRRRRGHALPDVLGPLAHAVDRPAGRLQHLAGAADELPGDEERDEYVGHPAEVAGPGDEVVLVAAVRVSGRVGVVLEQVDVAGDALLGEASLGVDEQALEDPLPRLVVDDEVEDASRTPAWRTPGGCRRRDRAGPRCAGTRWTSGPTRRPAGTGSGPPRRATAGAAHGTCT